MACSGRGMAWGQQVHEACYHAPAGVADSQTDRTAGTHAAAQASCQGAARTTLFSSLSDSRIE